MYTDPRNSWVREVAGGIPSLCSVLSWASSVHYTAYYCVMYCFIKHHRMKTCGDWKNSSTYAHSRQKVEVTAWSVGRSVDRSFRPSVSQHPLVKKLGRSRNLSAVRKHQHDCQWDRWNGTGGQTYICDEFRVGIQPLVVVFGTLPMSVSAITKRGSRWVPKKLSEPRYKSQCSGRKQYWQGFCPPRANYRMNLFINSKFRFEKLAWYKM